MQPIPPARWRSYLTRISHRYAGTPITLRQRAASDELANVVLWRTPLRGLYAAARGAQWHISVRAGALEPGMEIALGAIRSLALRLGDGDGLEALHLVSESGATSILLFEGEGGEEWL